jgi:hypothetical protein
MKTYPGSGFGVDVLLEDVECRTIHRVTKIFAAKDLSSGANLRHAKPNLSSDRLPARVRPRCLGARKNVP